MIKEINDEIISNYYIYSTGYLLGELFVWLFDLYIEYI